MNSQALNSRRSNTDTCDTVSTTSSMPSRYSDSASGWLCEASTPISSTSTSTSESRRNSTATQSESDHHTPPQTHLKSQCHPLEPQMTRQVNDYFIKYWPFKSIKEIDRFRAAGFSRVTCYYFPEARDERIGYACELLTLLFLVDDQLEDLSLAAGQAYNQRLMDVFSAKSPPDTANPIEMISSSLWTSMRSHDKVMADAILSPVFDFMRAQTDSRRLKPMASLDEYYEYREGDVGRALLAALMCFTMKLDLTKAETAAVRVVDDLCSKHISVVNDIYSWEKELRKFEQCSDSEGAFLCSSVKVVIETNRVNVLEAKALLWTLARQWEMEYFDRTRDLQGSENIEAYVRGIGWQMSGNEVWSRTTSRYK